jgi:MFS family permease
MQDVLSLGVVVWSLFTLLTPWAAATRQLPVLLLVRALMGLGEGVAFPTMQVTHEHMAEPTSHSSVVARNKLHTVQQQHTW